MFVMWLKKKLLMLFRRRNARGEYREFIDKVSQKYGEVGVKFNYVNHVVSTESPKEDPDHYAIFTYWVAHKLSGSTKLKFLDVGNTKVANLVNSIAHDVTALVLDFPNDDISSVNWLVHDISDELPFDESSFDVFTSPSTLHLIGQGRYGDRRDPFVLIKFKSELDRVMRCKSRMYLMLPLGKDQLMFGFHFIYSLDSIKKIFSGWRLVDYMVDDEVKFGKIKSDKPKAQRFDKDVDVSEFGVGDYKIVYLEFIKE